MVAMRCFIVQSPCLLLTKIERCGDAVRSDGVVGLVFAFNSGGGIADIGIPKEGGTLPLCRGRNCFTSKQAGPCGTALRD